MPNPRPHSLRAGADRLPALSTPRQEGRRLGRGRIARGVGPILVMGALLVTAAPAPEAFEQANRLYEQGQYAAAVQAYEALMARGQSSTAVLFNLGNACFKNGQVGRAILHYRQAEREAPRDPDVRANLQFARNTLPGSPPASARWPRWLPRLTLDESTLAGTASLWLWFGLLTLGQIWPSARRPLRIPRFLAGGAALLLLALTSTLWYRQLRTRGAIVIQPEVAAHFGPLEESQRAFTARDGVELSVTDAQGDWLQVVDANRRVGWLKRDQVAQFP